VSEVVKDKALFLRSAGWVGVPAGSCEGVLAGPWVFLVGQGLLQPCREVFQSPLRVDRVLPVAAVLRSPSERRFTKLLQVRAPFLMSDCGARRTVVFLRSCGCVCEQLKAKGVAGGVEGWSTPGRLWDTLEPVRDVARSDVRGGGCLHERGGGCFQEFDGVHPGGTRSVGGVVGDVAEGGDAQHVV